MKRSTATGWIFTLTSAGAMALAITGPTAAWSQQHPAPQQAIIIAHPKWVLTPNSQQFSNYYPDRALRMGIDGQATMSCAVLPDGSLTDCNVVSENPPDQGFGLAALKMARLFRMRPQFINGLPVGEARVNVPIRFRVPRESPPANSPGPSKP